MDRQLKSILMETPAGREYVRQEEAAKRAKSRRRSSRSPRATGPDKAAKREERRDRLSRIVAEVRGRSEGDCQVCGNPGDDAHHVASGPDRRLMESPQSMLWLCRSCHRLYHDGNVSVLICAADYCRENGMRGAAAIVERRLQKHAAFQAARREGETTP